MSSGEGRRPGVAYRRPNGDASTLVAEATGDTDVPVERVDEGGWLDAVHPDDRDRLREALAAPDIDAAYRLVVDDGETWVHERGRRVDDDVVGYLFSASERVERRRELERQRERLEEFASVVSHDLRNPLSVALGNLDLARDLDDGAGKRLERVETALQRMDALINDLLALAREGRTVEETEETPLAAVVDRAWRTVPDGDDATLVVEDLPRIECDRERLQQVFENLFRNSLEHGSPGDASLSADGRWGDGPVTLEVGSLPDGFYVADDGSGIDPARREDAFEPGHTTATDGTGFGLTIVDRIVEAHGWSVSITEHHTGGARFEFTDVDVVDDPTEPADPTESADSTESVDHTGTAESDTASEADDPPENEPAPASERPAVE